VAFPIFGSYAIIYLGFSKTISLGRAAIFGDVSYGTYLYGWPVEQCIRAAFGDGAKWWMVFSLSLPIALLLGFLSWHAIEKVALRYRSLPVWAQSAFRCAGLLGPLASPVKSVYRSDSGGESAQTGLVGGAEWIRTFGTARQLRAGIDAGQPYAPALLEQTRSLRRLLAAQRPRMFARGKMANLQDDEFKRGPV
jgi:hypothetical protein